MIIWLVNQHIISLLSGTEMIQKAQKSQWQWADRWWWITEWTICYCCMLLIEFELFVFFKCDTPLIECFKSLLGRILLFQTKNTKSCSMTPLSVISPFCRSQNCYYPILLEWVYKKLLLPNIIGMSIQILENCIFVMVNWLLSNENYNGFI